ncbi:PREDICTED: coiled-coil domain-containing protein 162-like [Propithecus coquereli]|uniref:coiled-coil domain-containing protein 162-like n=1 Tax=Propithecus coquereli TaxID=379532 RepID=UPI00063FB47E|nr:PREDICTED: coiled-coil domain-containing protein 162-like [Propithecus coquereli]
MTVGEEQGVRTAGGSELRELQKMIDSLESPQDPTQVAQALFLRREVMFLQFDAAVRHLIRRTFLAAGNVPAYQSVTDGMYHGLPPLSNSLLKSIFASQLSLPQPLDPRSPQAFVLFPWRAFLEDGGPFPVMSSSPDTLEYNMQERIMVQLVSALAVDSAEVLVAVVVWESGCHPLSLLGKLAAQRRVTPDPSTSSGGKGTF